MAKIKPKVRIEYSVELILNENEARALDALIGYGFDSFDKFLKEFYENMGKHYMEPHADGLRSLFKEITEQVLPQIGQIDAQREAIKEAFAKI